MSCLSCVCSGLQRRATAACLLASAVVAYGGEDDPGARRDGRWPVTVAADLAAVNREPSGGHAE
jgi:hypothetical protein